LTMPVGPGGFVGRPWNLWYWKRQLHQTTAPELPASCGLRAHVADVETCGDSPHAQAVSQRPPEYHGDLEHTPARGPLSTQVIFNFNRNRFFFFFFLTANWGYAYIFGCLY